MSIVNDIAFIEASNPVDSRASEMDREQTERIKDSLLSTSFEVVRKTYRETSNEDISRWIETLTDLNALETALCKKKGHVSSDYYEHQYDMSTLPTHPQDLFHHIQAAMQNVAERMEALTPAKLQLLIDFLKQLETKKNQQQ